MRVVVERLERLQQQRRQAMLQQNLPLQYEVRLLPLPTAYTAVVHHVVHHFQPPVVAMDYVNPFHFLLEKNRMMILLSQ
jgi:hypothetical protein